jgi:hypothetical protein
MRLSFFDIDDESDGHLVELNGKPAPQVESQYVGVP